MASLSSRSAAATVIQVPSWAWFLVVVALFCLYLVSQENGAVLSAANAEYLHEVTNDARHAFGVPRH